MSSRIETEIKQLEPLVESLPWGYNRLLKLKEYSTWLNSIVKVSDTLFYLVVDIEVHTSTAEFDVMLISLQNECSVSSTRVHETEILDRQCITEIEKWNIKQKLASNPHVVSYLAL